MPLTPDYKKKSEFKCIPTMLKEMNDKLDKYDEEFRDRLNLHCKQLDDKLQGILRQVEKLDLVMKKEDSVQKEKEQVVQSYHKHHQDVLDGLGERLNHVNGMIEGCQSFDVFVNREEIHHLSGGRIQSAGMMFSEWLQILKSWILQLRDKILARHPGMYHCESMDDSISISDPDLSSNSSIVFSNELSQSCDDDNHIQLKNFNNDEVELTDDSADELSISCQ